MKPNTKSKIRNQKWLPALALALLVGLAAPAAQAAVTVSNVSAAQTPGTKQVVITYDVASDATNAVMVTLAVSNGTSAVSAPSVSGDIGAEVPLGPGKSIVWDAQADWNGNVGVLDFCIQVQKQLCFGGEEGITSFVSRMVDARDYTLEVVSEHGTPVPAIGVHSNYCWHSIVDCLSGIDSNFKCTGWTGTGSVPLAGTMDSAGEITGSATIFL